MAIKKPNKQAQEEDVRRLGKEVGAFLEKYELKAEYIRIASHFGASKFSDFKKAS